MTQWKSDGESQHIRVKDDGPHSQSSHWFLTKPWKITNNILIAEMMPLWLGEGRRGPRQESPEVWAVPAPAACQRQTTQLSSTPSTVVSFLHYLNWISSAFYTVRFQYLSWVMGVLSDAEALLQWQESLSSEHSARSKTVMRVGYRHSPRIDSSHGFPAAALDWLLRS